MKAIGLFEAKTRLSEICETVATTHEPVTVTKRGRPFVRIEPIEEAVMTIRERRDAYMAGSGRSEPFDAEDFAPPARSAAFLDFEIKG